jgi:hypothetical protein
MLRTEPVFSVSARWVSIGYRMTKPAAFRQADVERAVKGVKACGLPVVRVRVLPGGIIDIITAGNDPEPEGTNPLDRLHAA